MLSIACLELAVVAHLLRHLARQAVLRGVVAGVDQPRQAGRDEVLELVLLQQVERLLVGKAGVVDHLDALLDALLDRPGGARMRRDAFAPGLGLLHAHRDLFFGELARLARHAGDRLARQVDLQRVDAVLGEHAHAAPHLVRAADDGAERELRLRQVRLRGVAQAAGHGDLLARCQVARADDGAVVDRVADHHVQARLGRGRADARGPAHVEINLGNLGAPQDVLFRRHALNGIEAGLVVPREMRVRLDHARHQERAGAVDHLRAGDRRRALAIGRS